MSLSASERQVFDGVYATDLVYVPDCWKLCGDAHCCSFDRHKARFKLLARGHFQELPLLPGEFEYLGERGWLGQFGDFEHRVAEMPIEGGVLRAESIVSTKAGCPCNHGTRPTICRLYPLLPVFDVHGRLVDAEPVGIYDELEQLATLPRACQVSALPFEQLRRLLTIAAALARSPKILFYLEAYRLTKRHVVAAVDARRKAGNGDAFAAFEIGMMRRRLIDQDDLRRQLDDLHGRFSATYGQEFSLQSSERAPVTPQ